MTSENPNGQPPVGGLDWNDDDYRGGKQPKRPGLGGRIARNIIVTVIIVGLLGGGALYAWNTFQPQITSLFGHSEGADYEGDGTGTVQVTIKKGDLGSDIAKTLYDAGVTKSVSAFYQLLIDTTPAPVFQPGVYTLHKQMSAKAALTLLQDPASRVSLTLAIPEGSTEAAILTKAAKVTGIPLAQLKAAAKKVSKYHLPSQAKTLEGFLFPATYTFDPGTTADDVIAAMVNRAKQEFKTLKIPTAKLWDTVVLASIVQAETGPDPKDPGKIARVFTNRLANGWRLQSDATVAYGSGSGHVLTTDAERADASNPYNTYVHYGLPAGPIGNPGEVALKAALHPTAGSWMYFATVNLKTGKTVFSTTSAEHQQAVNQLQAWCADPANATYCS